jgi:hypothetical protein
MCRDRVNVEYEMRDCRNNNWNHRQSKKSCKENFGSQARKTFNRFTTKTTVLAILHIIRKVLQCETVSLSGGNNSWFKEVPVTRDNKMMMTVMIIIIVNINVNITIIT